MTQRAVFQRLEQGKTNSPDDIATAAALAYSALSLPGPAMRQQLDSLIRPMLGNLSGAARRRICAILAGTPHVPRPLAEALSRLPATECAPFLIRTKALPREFLEQIQGQSIGHARAIASREDFDSRDANVKGDKTPERQRLELLVLERQLCSGHDIETERLKRRDPANVFDRLFILSLSKNPAFAWTEIADATGLTFRLVSEILADSCCSDAAAIYRFLGLDIAQSATLAMLFGGDRAPDREKLRSLKARFDATTNHIAMQRIAELLGEADIELPLPDNDEALQTQLLVRRGAA